ncbi:MAG: hypothetical protein OSB45_07760 [Pseudomonadales bacterium]|nr:hypothetical protein [Pseudomonadales bacterium]
MEEMLLLAIDLREEFIGFVRKGSKSINGANAKAKSDHTAHWAALDKFFKPPLSPIAKVSSSGALIN